MKEIYNTLQQMDDIAYRWLIWLIMKGGVLLLCTSAVIHANMMIISKFTDNSILQCVISFIAFFFVNYNINSIFEVQKKKRDFDKKQHEL